MKIRPGLVLVAALSVLGCGKQTSSNPPAAGPPAPGAQSATETKPPGAAVTKGAAAAPTAAKPESSRHVLVFRNVRSWNRKRDFEEALDELAFKYDVKSSAEMQKIDLTPYLFVVIPGAQWQDGYYRDYAENAAQFESYVEKGGTLVLELNGAERDGMT